MTDIVQTEKEATKLAEQLLEKEEEHRKRFCEERSKKTGKDIRYIQQLYFLEEIKTHSLGWLLIFHVEDVEDAIVEPPTRRISVNKYTGETKYGYFRESDE